MDEYFKQIEPYNLWGGNALPIGYKREEYLSRLMKYTGNRLIKVLTGQRRVGKSYLMRQVAMGLLAQGVSPVNTLFINKELSAFDFIKTADDLNALVKYYIERLNPEGNIYIFIDEVQDIEEWERAVNSLSQDYTLNIEVFISGSNSKLLSGELTTLLSGRYIEMTVFPFSYAEYLEIHDFRKGRESFMLYMSDGGLPELINLPDKEVKQRYVEGLRDSIMLKDIVKRYAVKDVALLENLFAYLVNNSSSLISISNIVNYLKAQGKHTSYDTVANYLVYFQEAFLLHKSGKYNISGKELLAGNFKIYPNDQAYHNYLFPHARFGRGYLLEGVVYMSLLRHGFKIHTGVVKGKEVDFIATKEYRTLYIQVAYVIDDETTAEREYESLRYVKGEGEKILVTADDFTLPVRDGVRHIQVWNIDETLSDSSALLANP